MWLLLEPLIEWRKQYGFAWIYYMYMNIECREVLYLIMTYNEKNWNGMDGQYGKCFV